MLGLLEVLRAQRHDFLNHLQVISGLLQLKKYDRAGEYIRQIGEELSRAGVLARLGCQPVVAEILIARLKAHKKGISLECSVNSGMETGVDKEEALAGIIREMLDTAISLAEVSADGHGSINFEIGEQNGEYLFAASFRTGEGSATDLDSRIAALQKAAEGIGGSFATGELADGTATFSLKVPMKKQCRDNEQ